MPKTIDGTKKSYPSKPIQQTQFRTNPSLVPSQDTIGSESFPTIPCKVVTIPSQKPCWNHAPKTNSYN